MTPIEFLLLCLMLLLFFWDVGKEYKLHDDRWYATGLLVIMILSTIVLLSTLKGML